MAKARRKLEGTETPDMSSPQSAADTTAATIGRDRVAQRAYELYLARGCGEGRELDDWLCAERELASGDRAVEGSSSRDDEM